MAPDRRAVLVVEDDPQGRRALERILCLEGFESLGVRDGLEALDAIEARPYHAVVCDIRMPILTGVEFFRLLCDRAPHMTSRVVFVTAFTGHPEIGRFLEESGRPYFEKPYDTQDLIDAVKRIAHTPGTDDPPGGPPGTAQRT